MAKFRMPASSRELLTLLSIADSAEAVRQVIGQVDMQAACIAQVYDVVHRRMPEADLRAKDFDQPSLQRMFAEAVLSDEFQDHIIAHVLGAFPEIPRQVFIHVPKCAGTDLVAAVADERVSLALSLQETGWTGRDGLFRDIGRIVRLARSCNGFFVHGHIPVSAYHARMKIRPQDSLLTIIRDPVDRVLSAVNYAVSRLVQDPAGAAPDTAEMLAFLGMQALPARLEAGELSALAERLLRNPAFIGRNEICRYLSDTGEASFEAAVRALVRFDIEVTTTAAYSDWLRVRWGIESLTWRNRSVCHLTRADALARCGDILRDATADDARLHDMITWAMARAGAPQVKGAQLARREGLEQLYGFTQAAADMAPEAGRQAGAMRILALGPAAAELAAAWPDAEAGQPAGTMDVCFGDEGDAGRFLGEGWSIAEPGFRWTLGRHAVVRLPGPHAGGAYRLKLDVTPVRFRDRVDFQGLGVRVNGVALPSLRIHDRAVVDIVLPAALLAGHAALELVFDLPNAVRPSDFEATEDRRELAFCFRRLRLERLVEPPPPAASSELTPAELAHRFESLGENCEFGLVQRRCGAEPIGLLRFASAPLRKLLAALDARFEGFGSPENLVVRLSNNGREYMVDDRRFGFNYHAWVKAGEMPPEKIHAREVRRVPFLVRKLIDDLERAEKIFVYHSMEAVAAESPLMLWRSLRGYGSPTLLWVDVAGDGHVAGTVEKLRDGLLMGYIDRFAPGEAAHDLSLDSWVEMLRQAAGHVRVEAGP